LTDVPLVLGSDSTADIRLEGSDVSARHATVWVRGGKLTLRHTGGVRPTLVDGMPVDVVILEDGDEFVIAGHRFRAAVQRAVLAS
jgi:hypothetical protein